MLAQNFKSADDLDITEADCAALMKVLVLMETGKMRSVPDRDIIGSGKQAQFDGLFNMLSSFGRNECGTTNCIRGAAIAVGGASFKKGTANGGLRQLFYQWIGEPTVEQGARALRNYLTYGEPRWAEVMENDNG